MVWLNDNLIDDKTIAFVYIIEHTQTGEFYIGKKNLYSFKKKIKTESNWKNYFGSNKLFLNYVKSEGKEMFKRTILMACDCSYKATYYEIDYLVKHNWITNEKCWNNNILGKFYKNKLK